jgi:hypothetical protein
MDRCQGDIIEVKKLVMRLWTGFIWLTVRADARLREDDDKPSTSLKRL